MEYVYGIDFQDILIAIVIGISISMLLYEKKGILSGGIITPAIISLFIPRIIFVLSTLCMVVVLDRLVTILRKHIMLYGRRLFSVVLLLGVSLVLMTRILMNIIHYFGYGMYIYDTYAIIKAPLIEFQIPKFLLDMGLGEHYYGYVIGLLIVPIIVNDTQNQGLCKTIIVLMGVSIITFLTVVGLKIL